MTDDLKAAIKLVYRLATELGPHHIPANDTLRVLKEAVHLLRKVEQADGSPVVVQVANVRSLYEYRDRIAEAVTPGMIKAAEKPLSSNCKHWFTPSSLGIYY